MAPDDGAGLHPCLRGSPQHLRLARSEPLITGTQLDPAGLHANAGNLPLQLPDHPLSQGRFWGVVNPAGDPRLPVGAGGHDDGHAGGL